MSPSEIRSAVLKQLQAARVSMMSARWTLSLEKMDAPARTQAANELLRVHHAIQELENQQLTEISDKLRDNEPDLLKGRDRLASALEDLKNTERVLTAVSSFISVVGRIVPLLV